MGSLPGVAPDHPNIVAVPNVIERQVPASAAALMLAEPAIFAIPLHVAQAGPTGK